MHGPLNVKGVNYGYITHRSPGTCEKVHFGKKI